MACGADQVGRGFDVEADDLDGALRVIAARPDADVSRVVVAGQSFGGGVALAFAARQPKGLVGVVNISGGVWRADGAGKTCVWDDLRHAFAAFGARVQVPTLWLYAENDALFPPEVVRELRDAFVNAGGKADLRMFKPVVGDGHLLFSDFTGRINWLRAFDEFLAANALPNVNTARAERVMQVTKLPAGARKAIDDYLAAPEPKAFAFAPAFKSGHWFAVPQGMSAARERALARCREKVGTDCTVVFENNTMVAPEPVTTRMTSN
jgi:dienelactone hydrolase